MTQQNISWVKSSRLLNACQEVFSLTFQNRHPYHQGKWCICKLYIEDKAEHLKLYRRGTAYTCDYSWLGHWPSVHYKNHRLSNPLHCKPCTATLCPLKPGTRPRRGRTDVSSCVPNVNARRSVAAGEEGTLARQNRESEEGARESQRKPCCLGDCDCQSFLSCPMTSST